MNELILIISAFMFFACLVKANLIDHKAATRQVKAGLIGLLSLYMGIILLDIYHLAHYSILFSLLLLGFIGFFWLCYETDCQRCVYEKKS